MKQLTLGDIWELVQAHDLPHHIPVVIVGEREVAVGVQLGFDEDGEVRMEPVAVMVQLIPR